MILAAILVLVPKNYETHLNECYTFARDFWKKCPSRCAARKILTFVRSVESIARNVFMKTSLIILCITRQCFGTTVIKHYEYYISSHINYKKHVLMIKKLNRRYFETTKAT